MERYDPLQIPDPSDWLALGESARIDLVLKYHRDVEVELPNERLHATIHVVVENQLALSVDPVPTTIARLMRQGLDRHEAVHAVGAIFAEDIYDLINAGDRNGITIVTANASTNSQRNVGRKENGEGFA